MSRLFMLLLTLTMGTMAGIGVIVVLTLGYVAIWPILIAAGTGAALSVPATWYVTRAILAREGR